MNTNQEQCPYSAEFVYPFAGKIMKGCTYHTNAMRKIAETIGYPMEIKQLIQTGLCDHPNDLPDDLQPTNPTTNEHL